jgi:hypothetical protein
MFYLSRSYNNGWRVFVAVYGTIANTDVHTRIGIASIWGGPDKTQEIHGVAYRGYEFRSIREATNAINVAIEP